LSNLIFISQAVRHQQGVAASCWDREKNGVAHSPTT